MRIIPDAAPLKEHNDCHEPAGSPEGGQFCDADGVPSKRAAYSTLPPGERRLAWGAMPIGTRFKVSGKDTVFEKVQPASYAEVVDGRPDLSFKYAGPPSKGFQPVREDTAKDDGPVLRKRPSVKDRAKGISQMKIAAGGVTAEKEQKRLRALAKGRETQRMVRAIRKDDEVTRERDTPSVYRLRGADGALIGRIRKVRTRSPMIGGPVTHDTSWHAYVPGSPYTPHTFETRDAAEQFLKDKARENRS